jgi:putative transposase
MWCTFFMWTRYAKNAGAVFSLKYHLVWCPNYRMPVLPESVAARLSDVIHRVADELEATIHVHEIMPDRVHLFVESDPRWSVAEIVNRLKGTSSRILRAEFPHLKSRLPTLWSKSYYAGTIGSVSEETVRHYIENQKRR